MKNAVLDTTEQIRNLLLFSDFEQNTILPLVLSQAPRLSSNTPMSLITNECCIDSPKVLNDILLLYYYHGNTPFH